MDGRKGRGKEGKVGRWMDGQTDRWVNEGEGAAFLSGQEPQTSCSTIPRVHGFWNRLPDSNPDS